MMALTTSDTMAEAAKRHADLILKASGSGLRHYTMQKMCADILKAVMDCYDEGYRAGLNSQAYVAARTTSVEE